MPVRSVVAFTAILSAAGLAVGRPSAHSAPRPAERALADAERVAAARGAEIARIQRHFDSVLVELRAAPAARALTADRRAAREARIAELRAYRDRGVFPHNHDFGRTPTPYFVDPETGVRCAVAHLLEASGRGDVVRRPGRGGVRRRRLAERSEGGEAGGERGGGDGEDGRRAHADLS